MSRQKILVAAGFFLFILNHVFAGTNMSDSISPKPKDLSRAKSRDFDSNKFPFSAARQQNKHGGRTKRLARRAWDDKESIWSNRGTSSN